MLEPRVVMGCHIKAKGHGTVDVQASWPRWHYVVRGGRVSALLLEDQVWFQGCTSRPY